MAKQTKSQIFRDTATDEDWLQLVQDQEALTKDDFTSKYGFSWGSVRTDAIEKGFYTPKRRSSGLTSSDTAPEGQAVQKVKATPSFIVADRPAERKKITRSVQIDEDIYKRLQSLEATKNQYTHSSILNQLLDDALKKYGY